MLTVNFDVHLLQPVSDGRLAARGEVVHEAGSSLLAQAVVRDAAGQQAARGTGSFVKGNHRLAEIAGYRLPKGQG